MQLRERGPGRGAGRERAASVAVALLGDPTGQEGEIVAAVDAVQRSAVVAHSYIHEELYIDRKSWQYQPCL